MEMRSHPKWSLSDTPEEAFEACKCSAAMKYEGGQHDATRCKIWNMLILVNYCGGARWK